MIKNKLENAFDHIIFNYAGQKDTESTYDSLAKQFNLSKSKTKRLFWQYWDNVAEPQMLLWAWKEDYSEKEAESEIAEIKNNVRKQLKRKKVKTSND